MARLVQSPTGAGQQARRKKQLWFTLWFIVSGIIRDIHCVSAINKNVGALEKASNYSSNKDLKNQPLNRNASSTPKDAGSQTGAVREGRAVPPRVRFPNQDDTDYRDYLNDEVLGYMRKIPIHILELQSSKSKVVARPERSNEDEDTSLGYAADSGNQIDSTETGGYSNSVIPYPKNGRGFWGSYEDVHEEGNVYNNMITNGNSLSEDNDFVFTDGDDSNVEELPKGDQMNSKFSHIPYTKPASRNLETAKLANTDSRVKRETSDYAIPQMRYGRSMILLSTTKTDKPTTEKPYNFVLPYPRPGRSSKYANVMLPYPRPGRSGNKHAYKELFNSIAKEKRQGYMLPSARLGRSTLNSRFEGNDVVGIGEGFLGLKVNPLLLKSTPEKSKDIGDSSSLFVIPYPRPGKKSLPKMTAMNKNGKNVENKNVPDYMLPYPRPGKKSYKLISKEKSSNANNAENFIVPYPTPGRSNDGWFETGNENENSNEVRLDMNSVSKNLVMEDALKNEFENMISNSQSSYLNLFKKSKSNLMIPNARLGRDYAEDSEEDSFYLEPNVEEQEYDYDPDVSEMYLSKLNENDISLSRFKRSNSVVPYPRPGRSNSIVPYPRLGRSNSVVPYPRPGRSNSIVPYPRPGKSITVVPYPRPGRSNTIVPYPRFGRSDTDENPEILYTVIPYPRPGRTSSTAPDLRQRRSNSLTMSTKQKLPNDGHSIVYSELNKQRPNFLIPNIRPGRFSGDEATYILPYPRPGRSFEKKDSEISFMIPYPRPGRSFEKKNTDTSYMIPYPRPGRAFEKKDSDSSFMIPYPRPGRSYEKKDSDTGFMIPYPRPGRSTKNGHGYVLPHPRVGRSDENTSNENETSHTNTVIPYPRLGRSQKQATPSPEGLNSVHKLNKHMLSHVDDSIYLLPYPRPGRYSE